MSNDNQLDANDITTLRNNRANYWIEQAAAFNQGIAADNSMLQLQSAAAPTASAGETFTANASPTLFYTLGDLPNTSDVPNMAPFQALGATSSAGGPDIVAFSAGLMHSMLLTSNGTVWTCGWNAYGQLGDGSATDRNLPVPVPNLNSIIAVSAQGAHSMALQSNGTVWTWGNNDYGQLGDGSTTSHALPIQVPNLSGIIAISAGNVHSMALKNDGTVWMWGANNYGQLGDGSTTTRTSPIQVPNLSGIITISTGTRHSIALKSDGTVWTWGNNGTGALGDGTTTKRLSPVQVTSLSNVIAISAGSYHSMALKSESTLWTWGLNDCGQLGDGTKTNRTLPVQVLTLSSITAIAAGDVHSMAAKSDGTLWAWGDNYYGELGDSTQTDHYSPLQVPNLSGIIAISVGSGYSMALRNDGALWGWGYNGNGQLGDGTTTDHSTPVLITGPTVLAVSAGASHSMLLKSNGTVWTWGDNGNGQLGNGATPNSSSPVKLSNLSDITAIVAGSNHSMALQSDGTVWSCGNNYYGQLGDGTTTNCLSPVHLQNLSGITMIAAGNYHSMALKSDGTVWAWGWNNYGQLGDGTTINRLLPVQLAGLSDIIAIAAGVYHSIALKSDGTVWNWGAIYLGQLGDGSTTNCSLPVQVPGFSDIIAISAGDNHSMALKSDGTVWTWGTNYRGQLGDGGVTTNCSLPMQVPDLSGISAISARVDRNMVLKNDGAVWIWGDNYYGRPYDKANPDQYIYLAPVQIEGLTDIRTISAGDNHNLALKNDGTIWTWGDNTCGQLGDNTDIPCYFPMCIGNGIPEVNPYTITYNANGGAGAPAAQTKRHGVALTLSSVVPTRTNYVFMGWAITSNATVAAYDPGGTFTANANTTLYAVWNLIYTVTYDANGGSDAPAAQTTSDRTLTLSYGIPTRKGYAFIGWATTANATTPVYDASGTFTANVSTTLYAVWRIAYTITFNSNGGVNGVFTQVKADGVDFVLPNYYLTRAGYVFMGWALSAVATVPTYIAGGIITANADITLYAVWGYAITYNANGGTGVPPTQTKLDGVDLTLSTLIPTKAGATFMGWATTANATAPLYSAGGTFIANASTTLYAVWGHIITYNANGGTGGPSTQTKADGATLTLISVKPTKTGCVFMGWATTASATVPLYSAGGTFTINADTTLYAVWGYTINYNANGGTGAPAAQTKADGATLTLSSVTPKKTDCIFMGWATAANSTDITYSAGGTFSTNANTTLYAVWGYTISYSANGGAGAPAAQIKADGATLTLSPAVPTKTGCIFMGWATASDPTIPVYSAGGMFTENGNTTIYAVWGHSIIYNANGGTGAPTAQTKADGATLTLSSAVPVKAGCVFMGWALTANATVVEYSTGGAFTTNADTTLYAVWGYTITYNANGGTGAPVGQTKADGAAVTLSPVIPAKTGCIFMGWATASDLTVPAYSPGGTFTANTNTTLYAVWGYTVAYNGNGGEGAPAAQIKADGVALTLSSVILTRAGYVFMGWATTANATVVEYSTEGTFTTNANTTLYAVWGYTISYNGNGGEGAPAFQTKADGATLTLSSVIPTKTGCTFMGWATTANATVVEYSTGGTFTTNANTTLYAVWGYTISYNANGGTGTLSNQIKADGATLTLSLVTPTRTGYVFTGWATTANATDPTYSAGGAFTANANTVLYAVWGYTITYNANGGTGAPDAQTKADGATLTLSFVKPTKTGYAFIGWAPTANATVPVYSAGGTFSANANTILYAVWNTVPSVTIDVTDQSKNTLKSYSISPVPYGPYTVDANEILKTFPGYEFYPNQQPSVTVDVSVQNPNPQVEIRLAELLCSLEVIYYNATDNKSIMREVMPASYNKPIVLTAAKISGYTFSGSNSPTTVIFTPTDNVLERLRTVMFQYTFDNAGKQGVRVSFKDPDGKIVYQSFVDSPFGGITINSADYLGLPELAGYRLMPGEYQEQSFVILRTKLMEDCIFTVETNVLNLKMSDMPSQTIAAANSSFWLQADSSVWACGYNNYGQLGDGTATNRSIPIAVNSLTDTISLSASPYHTVALKSGGIVWDWGRNDYGQLGNGTTTNQSTPGRVFSLYYPAAAVTAGYYNTFALMANGTVYAWGWNGNGMLGDGTTTNKSTPVQVKGLVGVAAVSASDYHVVALLNDGSVWTWGNNDSGQLGDGTTTNRTTPVKVNIGKVIAVAAAPNRTIALKSDGTLWAWGKNNYGQIGDGTIIDRLTPVQVNGLTGATTISISPYHTVALKSDGSVWTWGYNAYGQLGGGGTTDRHTPAQVSGLTGVKAIVAGFYHTVAQKSDRTIWAWGDNRYGQLGDGTTVNRSLPTQVTYAITYNANGGSDAPLTQLKAHGVALTLSSTIPTRSGYAFMGWGTTANATAPAYDVGGAFATNANSTLYAVWEFAFYREYSAQWQVTNGTRYWAPIEGQHLQDTDLVPVTLNYNTDKLLLENFIAQIPGQQATAPGNYPDAYLQIDGSSLGAVQFRCTRQVDAGQTWSGPVTLLQFMAIGTGQAKITLS